jgi:transcriptional regulator with XRE-family HTH domain
MGLGSRIRQRRADIGMSAAELARRADISKGYVSEIESDDPSRTSRPSAEVLFRIATALGTTVADLLGKEVRPATRGIPAELKKFADEADLPQQDVQMLAQIRFRGAQPQTAEDWRFLYESIKRSVRRGPV